MRTVVALACAGAARVQGGPRLGASATGGKHRRQAGVHMWRSRSRKRPLKRGHKSRRGGAGGCGRRVFPGGGASRSAVWGVPGPLRTPGRALRALTPAGAGAVRTGRAAAARRAAGPGRPGGERHSAPSPSALRCGWVSLAGQVRCSWHGRMGCDRDRAAARFGDRLDLPGLPGAGPVRARHGGLRPA